MKPFKAAQPLASWLLRIFVSSSIFTYYYKNIWPVSLHSLHYYLSVVIVIAAILLVTGGLLSKPTVTILAGFVICALCTYHIITIFSGVLDPRLHILLLWFAGGLYFVSFGNK